MEIFPTFEEEFKKEIEPRLKHTVQSQKVKKDIIILARRHIREAYDAGVQDTEYKIMDTLNN